MSADDFSHDEDGRADEPACNCESCYARLMEDQAYTAYMKAQAHLDDCHDRRSSCDNEKKRRQVELQFNVARRAYLTAQLAYDAACDKADEYRVLNDILDPQKSKQARRSQTKKAKTHCRYSSIHGP